MVLTAYVMVGVSMYSIVSPLYNLNSRKINAVELSTMSVDAEGNLVSVEELELA